MYACRYVGLDEKWRIYLSGGTEVYQVRFFTLLSKMSFSLPLRKSNSCQGKEKHLYTQGQTLQVAIEWLLSHVEIIHRKFENRLDQSALTI